jgi:hypothetical protein
MVLFGGVVLQADRRAAKIKMTHERILIRIVSQYRHYPVKCVSLKIAGV